MCVWVGGGYVDVQGEKYEVNDVLGTLWILGKIFVVDFFSNDTSSHILVILVENFDVEQRLDCCVMVLHVDGENTPRSTCQNITFPSNISFF